MALLRVTSPHTHAAVNTTRVMLTVVMACVPGMIALTLYFGYGSLMNIALCTLFCLAFEAVVLCLRKRTLAFYLKDYSAVVTGVLLGIALPPYAAWWLICVGAFFSIVVAKQLYGGLGCNPFNPAMVGYVVLLISFPIEMTQWLMPLGLSGEGAGFIDGMRQVLLNSPLSQFDGYTAATPLDVLKQNNAVLLQDLYQQESVFNQGRWAGAGWEWANIGFLAGGIFLLYRRVFTWHAPVSMLITLALLSSLFYDGGSSASPGSPLFHLLSGGTMFGAFFIVTDPVSSAVSNKGRLIYGALAGIIIYVIRVWGNYPDAVAFAVLLTNFAAPFIDYYTLPRAYGHTKAESGRTKNS